MVNFTPTVAPPSPLPDPEPTLYLFLSGMGESAQIALSSATQTQLNTSNTQFQALAFNPTDAFNSTLYVANSSATPGQVHLLPSTGGSLTRWNEANTTSLNYPSDASFDAFDRLTVVSDYYGGKVYEYAPTTLTQTTVSTTGFTMVQPTQAEVDLGGNLYIADTNPNNTSRIIQVPGEAYVPNQLLAEILLAWYSPKPSPSTTLASIFMFESEVCITTKPAHLTRHRRSCRSLSAATAPQPRPRSIPSGPASPA